jgi:hypothetical protein
MRWKVQINGSLDTAADETTNTNTVIDTTQ